MKLIPRFLVTMVTLLLLNMTGLIAAQRVDTSEYAGDWVSISCEWRPSGDPENPAYLTRRWTFDEELNLSARFTFYADSLCEVALFTVGFDGRTELAGFNPVADGALNTNFRLTNLYLQPDNEGFLETLIGLDPACGAENWELGVEQEISETGCPQLGFAPIDLENLTGENDMIYLRADHLYFGARLLDGSSPLTDEDRPTALQIPLVRAGTMQGSE